MLIDNKLIEFRKELQKILHSKEKLFYYFSRQKKQARELI
jgi:hypothetical protein